MNTRNPLLSIALVAFLLPGCNGPVKEETTPLKIDMDFSGTSTDWAGGYADYAPDTQPDDVIVETRRLPEPFAGNGLYTSGTNRSDDLFIYIKKKFPGFLPNHDYLLNFSVTFLTDAPAGCVGVGGPPGESVTLKAGATPIEPLTILVDGEYRMNIDKGEQVNSGKDAIALGDIAGTNTDCDRPVFESKTLASSTLLKATSDAGGSMWLMFGIDSGFEAASEIYYQSATVAASPANLVINHDD
ncbi:MAG: hypothetical protein H0X43_12175 [Nitrosospira sp.]|nr:hypothetical protein [Nitrosospira sp.]